MQTTELFFSYFCSKFVILIKMKKILFVLSFIIFSVANLNAQSQITGKWKTIDDETGKPRSIVEIYEQNGKIYGKVLELLNRTADEEKDPNCDKCTDDRKGKRVIGMTVIRDMTSEGTYWDNGTILDPKNGKVYSCRLTMNKDGSLDVRGYMGFSLLGRSQKWVRP